MIDPLDQDQMLNRRRQLKDRQDKAVDELLEITRELERQGEEVIIKGVSEELTEAQKKAMVAQIKAAAQEADSKIKEWVVPTIATAYLSGLEYTNEALASFDIIFKNNEKLTIEVLRGVEEFKPHLDAVNSLISDAYLDFGSGITGFVRATERVLNDVTRQQVREKIASGRLAGQSIREIRNEVRNVLRAQGLEAVIDRGGRQWSLDRYSEMLTRTHVIKANNEATLLRAAEAEIDIVQVSKHAGACPICTPFESKIYSRSGRSKNYPPLTAANKPPYHPNCRHNLLLRPDLD
jgi:hypothetical protein